MAPVAATMTTFLLSAVLALLLTPLVIGLVHRWQLIDVPNHRSLHSSPIPRGGGIAVLAATVLAVAFVGEWNRPITALVVGGVVLGGTGFADDRWTLSALPRLGVQIMTPVAVGILIADRATPWLVVAAVVVAGYVNAFNFMDGINGISGSQAAIAGGLLALVANDVGADSLAIAGWAVCGASVGFLPFNAIRTRIFLGDVGSYFLGFWLAGLALLVVDAGAPVMVVVGPFLLYLLDTSTVLVRRARRRERLTEPHREHAYQRLVQAGWSHPVVAGLCAAVSAACGAIMYVVRDASTAAQFFALAGCVGLVVGYLALPSMVGGGAVERAAA
jgi:UDP-GlcNAc:undecaprenyl-phosphate/decaprenyl-phosphate GlcNAc-1-phosphate transferase